MYSLLTCIGVSLSNSNMLLVNVELNNSRPRMNATGIAGIVS